MATKSRRTGSGRSNVIKAMNTPPIRKQMATTGLGPNRSANRELASAPRIAPPLNTSRKASEPLALNPACSISTGNQVLRK